MEVLFPKGQPVSWRFADIRPRPSVGRLIDVLVDERAAGLLGASLKLIGNLIQAGLDAGFVDARRAGEANAADKVIARLDRKPARDSDDVRQRHLLAHHGVAVSEPFRIRGSRGAKAEGCVGFAAAFSMVCGLELSPRRATMVSPSRSTTR
jgi:hypothetical protein